MLGNVGAGGRFTRTRVTSIARSSELIGPNSLFVYVGNGAFSNRSITTSVIGGNTTTIIYRRSLNLRGRIIIRGAETMCSRVYTGFFKGPTRGLGLVNMANAGNGAAAAFLIGRVLRGTNGGINLVNAIRGVIYSRMCPTGCAAPSPRRLRGLFSLVIGTNYRCYIVRISSRTLTRNEMGKLAFRVTTFSGLARSRLSCRGA